MRFRSDSLNQPEILRNVSDYQPNLLPELVGIITGDIKKTPNKSQRQT